MFNFQALVQFASQAMLRKMVASDTMFEQWKAFSQKWGLPQTSRAEFDTLVSQFNNTDPQAKLNQLSNMSNLLQSIGFDHKICGLEKELAACCCSTQNTLNTILDKLPTSGTTPAA